MTMWKSSTSVLDMFLFAFIVEMNVLMTLSPRTILNVKNASTRIRSRSRQVQLHTF